jgi:hypothetical protein
VLVPVPPLPPLYLLDPTDALACPPLPLLVVKLAPPPPFAKHPSDVVVGADPVVDSHVSPPPAPLEPLPPAPTLYETLPPGVSVRLVIAA